MEQFNSLYGEHILTGVDQGFFYEDTNAYTMIVELDGISYMFIEDPEDCFRSSFDQFIVTDRKPAFRFEPQKVICKDASNSMFDGIEIYSANTGRVIIRIGTDYHTCYYPCCEFTYLPENLDVNRQGE